MITHRSRLNATSVETEITNGNQLFFSDSDEERSQGLFDARQINDLPHCYMPDCDKVS